jgi:hypothetical protein
MRTSFFRKLSSTVYVRGGRRQGFVRLRPVVMRRNFILSFVLMQREYSEIYRGIYLPNSVHSVLSDTYHYIRRLMHFSIDVASLKLQTQVIRSENLFRK